MRELLAGAGTDDSLGFIALTIGMSGCPRRLSLVLFRRASPLPLSPRTSFLAGAIALNSPIDFLMIFSPHCLHGILIYPGWLPGLPRLYPSCLTRSVLLCLSPSRLEPLLPILDGPPTIR